jgi:hypothetical protein
VDVDQERLATRARGVAQEPAMHLGAVGDLEAALLAREELDPRERLHAM